METQQMETQQMETQQNGNDYILSVQDLSIRFRQYGKGLEQADLEVISALDLMIRSGEIAAVIGSSGSGKSLLAHAILGILPPNASVSGEVLYRGQPLIGKRLKSLRGTEIAFIPQSISYLDPTMRVGKQTAGVRGDESKVREVFARYNLDEEVMRKYPFELSGGMARRVLTAAAVIGGAKLIIADEPTPGMSEDLANEALTHLRELADSGCAVMLITHDLSLALPFSDKLVIFYAGLTVESAGKEDFSGKGERLRHPYTKALWDALPQNGFTPLAGFQPYAGTAGPGCPFFSRCPVAEKDCAAPAAMRDLRGGKVRCLHAA
jgi:peptide/nickel transport system ATP-binding protein